MINALSVLRREAEAEKEGGEEAVEGDLNDLLPPDEAKAVPVWSKDVSEPLANVMGKLMSVTFKEDTSNPWHDITEHCFKVMSLMTMEGREKGSNLTDTKAMSLTSRYFFKSEPAEQAETTSNPKALKRDTVVSVMVEDKKEDLEVLYKYRVKSTSTKSYDKW